MDLSNCQTVAVGTNKLEGRGHYTRDRFLSMVLRKFVFHNRVVVTANMKTFDLASRLVDTFQKLKMVEVEEGRMKKPAKNGDIEIIYWVLDLKPILRRD